MMPTTLLKTFLLTTVLCSALSAHADSIFLEPTKDELNLPFTINDGKIEIHLPDFRHRNPGNERLIAQCKISYFSKSGLEENEVKVWKSQFGTDAIVNTTVAGKTNSSSYPFVYTKTITKESLGQYSTAVEVAQMLGITKVDSLKVLAIDSNLSKLKDLIFFYDDEGFLLDRTIFIHNHWMRCDHE